MPNNARTQADGTWIDGYEPTPDDWADLERKIFASWNGDKGGVYVSPSAAGGGAWTIGGSGLKVTGTTRLSYGGSIRGGASAFVIGDGSWPELGATHSARSRSIVCPIVSWNHPLVPSETGGYDFQTKMSRAFLWSTNHPYVGVGSTALASKLANTSVVETPELYIPLRVIDGSVLTSVTLHFRVAVKRIYAPIRTPQIRVLRVPKLSGDLTTRALPEPLKETTDGKGFDGPELVASAAAWYNDGDVQTFTYVCDQNNEIDLENYSYLVHLVEETGVLSSNDPFDGIRFVERKRNVTLVGTNSLTLSGVQSVDGINTINGDRVLIVDTDSDFAYGVSSSAFASLNGFWDTSTSTTWTRSSDLTTADQFTPYFLVVAAGASSARFGKTNNLSAWQCSHPSNNQTVELAAAGAASVLKTQPWFQPAVPRGNIYHALVPTFEVSDLRFQ